MASTESHCVKLVEPDGHSETSQIAPSHTTPAAEIVSTFTALDVAKSVSTESAGVMLPCVVSKGWIMVMRFSLPGSSNQLKAHCISSVTPAVPSAKPL